MAEIADPETYKSATHCNSFSGEKFCDMYYAITQAYMVEELHLVPPEKADFVDECWFNELLVDLQSELCTIEKVSLA